VSDLREEGGLVGAAFGGVGFKRREQIGGLGEDTLAVAESARRQGGQSKRNI